MDQVTVAGAQKSMERLAAQKAKLQEVAGAYRALAATAEKGSAQQVAATQLAEKAEARLSTQAKATARDIERAGRTASESLERAGRSTTRFGRSWSMNVTAPIVAAGALSERSFEQFELIVSRWVGLAGLTAKQAVVVRKSILDMSVGVGKGPQELAEAYYQIASAGVKGARAMDTLRVSAKASQAGLGDVDVVADALTSVLNAYEKDGLTAAKAADIFTAAVRDGKGEAAAFAPVIGKVAANAAPLGIAFDEVAAALARMTQFGVPVDDAATQLSSVFAQLIKVTPEAEKTLKAVGLSGAALRQEFREKGLLATISDLNERFRGSGVAMARVFGDARAMRGIMQLLGGDTASTARVFDHTANSANSLKTAFGAVAGTEAFKTQQTLARIKKSSIELGEALVPFKTKLAEAINSLTHAFEKLTPKQKKVFADLAVAVAVGGPLLLFVGAMAGAAANVLKLVEAMGKLKTVSIPAWVAGLAKIGAYGFGGVSNGIDQQRSIDAIVGNGGQDLGNGYVLYGGTYYKVGKKGDTTKVSADEALGAGSGGMTSNPGSAVDALTGRTAKGHTGSITPGLAAVEKFSGGKVLNDFATSGHTKGSMHYTGQAVDLAADPLVWGKLLAHKDSFAELLGPWGLYDHGVEYYDKDELAGHSGANAHIHVGYSGSASAIQKLMRGGGGTSTSSGVVDPNYDPGHEGQAKKPKIRRGSVALLGDDLVGRISKAGDQASMTSGATALGWLKKERDALLEAQKKLAGELEGSKGKQRSAILAESRSIASQLASVNKQISSNLKAQATAIKAAYRPLIQDATQAISSAFSQIITDARSVFNAQTQAFIDDTLGPKYFQGVGANGMGLLTPKEKQLAEMQAADTAQSLVDGLASAQKQLADDMNGALIAHILDIHTGAERDVYGNKGTPAQVAASKKAVEQAQRMIDENKLSIEATAERAQADKSYADAVKQYQQERSVAESSMVRQLEQWGRGLADGTVKLSDLGDELAKFGVSLSDLPAEQVASDMGILSDAIRALSEVLIAEAQALAKVGNSKGAAEAAARAAALVIPSDAPKTIPGTGINFSRFVLASMMRNVEGMDTGGDILRDGLIYAHAGEKIQPAVVTHGTGGGSTIIVNVNAPNYVGDKRDLIAAIKGADMSEHVGAAVTLASRRGHLRQGDIRT
jgi:TP901 family phage tail tape measure protein